MTLINPKPQHFIITRYGIGVREAEWYEYRIKIFSNITLPSVVSQHRLGLYWLIVIDFEIPCAAYFALKDKTDPYEFIHLVKLDSNAIPVMEQGGFGWVWRHLQCYLLSKGVVEDTAIPIITSIIDDDDAWNRNVISLVDSHVLAHGQACIESEIDYSRGYLVRHSFGIFMTFRHGVVMDVDAGLYRNIDNPAQSMSVFVYCRFSSNISACSARHLSWPNFVHVVGFEMHTINDDDLTPMWLYFRHKRVMSEHRGAEGGKKIDSNVIDLIENNFSVKATEAIDAAQSFEDRATFAPTGVDSNSYTQLDLQFRVSALQHHSDCLRDELRSVSPATNKFEHLSAIFQKVTRDLDAARMLLRGGFN